MPIYVVCCYLPILLSVKHVVRDCSNCDIGISMHVSRWWVNIFIVLLTIHLLIF